MGGRGSSSRSARTFDPNRSLPGAPDSFNEFLAMMPWFSHNEPYPDNDIDYMANGLNHTLFQSWLEKMGDYGKSEIMDEDEFFDYLDKNPGAALITRGMPDSQRLDGVTKLEQVMYSDKYYAGQGIYGDGLYFGQDSYTAVRYATSRGGNGAVMAAALRPDAKLAQYTEIRQEFLDLCKKPGVASGPNNLFIDDSALAVFARSKGYDAIVANRGGGTPYINVLNRSAMVVSSKVVSGNSSELRSAASEWDMFNPNGARTA